MRKEMEKDAPVYQFLLYVWYPQESQEMPYG